MLQSEFWKHVNKDGPRHPILKTKCWLWARSVTGGYGRVHYLGKDSKAHRVAYLLSRGAIPIGLMICHKCDVRICVRPAHLFLGTHLDNMADRNSKGRQSSGERHWLRKNPEARLLRSGELSSSAKFTYSDVQMVLRLRRVNRLEYREIGRLVGMSKSQVFNIDHGISRKVDL